MAKNPDYTATAIELRNSNETKNALQAWARAVKYAEGLLHDITQTEAYKEYETAQAEANKYRDVVKAAIDLAGSYQDVAAGEYAVKQRRQAVAYSIEKIRQHLPEWADKLVDEKVNETAMKGLLKGKLIQPEAAELCEVVTDLPEAYIIKVLEPAAPEPTADQALKAEEVLGHAD